MVAGARNGPKPRGYDSRGERENFLPVLLPQGFARFVIQT